MNLICVMFSEKIQKSFNIEKVKKESRQLILCNFNLNYIKNQEVFGYIHKHLKPCMPQSITLVSDFTGNSQDSFLYIKPGSE